MLSLRSDYQPPYPAYPGVFNLLLQFSKIINYTKFKKFYFFCNFSAFFPVYIDRKKKGTPLGGGALETPFIL